MIVRLLTQQNTIRNINPAHIVEHDPEKNGKGIRLWLVSPTPGNGLVYQITLEELASFDVTSTGIVDSNAVENFLEEAKKKAAAEAAASAS